MTFVYSTEPWVLNSTNGTLLSTPVGSPLPLEGQCKWTGMNTLLAGFLCLTLVVNVCAAVIILRVPMTTKRGTLNPVYLCIRALNAIDILQALLLLVTPFFSDSNCIWWGGDVCCKAMGFLALLFVMASPLITVIMAIDRTVAIYLPIAYRNFLGIKMLKILLPSFIIFTLALIIPPLFGVGEYHVVRGRRLCLLDTITDDITDRNFVLTVHAFYLLFLIFMMVCTFVFECKVIRLFVKKKTPSINMTSKLHMNNNTEKTAALRRRANTATRTTMAVCFTFVSCYTPFVARVLYEAATMKKSPAAVTWITFSLALLQPLLNPIVCLATNLRYRTEMKIVLRRMKRNERRWLTDSMVATFNTSEKFIHTQGSIKSSPSKDFGRRRLNSSVRSRVTPPPPPPPVEQKAGRFSYTPTASTEEKHFSPPEVLDCAETHTQVVYHDTPTFYPEALILNKNKSQDSAKEIDNNQTKSKKESDHLNNQLIADSDIVHCSDAECEVEMKPLLESKDMNKQESKEPDLGVVPDVDFEPDKKKLLLQQEETSDTKAENRDSGVDVTSET